MVLRLMYPIDGNEAAIGLDYRTLPDQIKAVQQALDLNRIVLAGPVAMVQGGEGLIARIPIHVNDAVSDQERFWGFASVVMNIDALFSGAGIGKQNSLRLSIRGKDGHGEDGEVFHGDPGVFDNQPVTQWIELPHGSWQMGAKPADGWTRYSALSDPLIWAYLATSLAILIFATATVYLLVKNRSAVEALQRERDLFAEGPVFTMEWRVEQQGDWPIRWVSSNVEMILGYSQAEMLQQGFSYLALIHPDDAASVVNRLRNNAAAGLDRYEESYRLQTPTGHYLWLRDFTYLLRDRSGRFIGIRSYLYDQMEQKQTEEALRIAEQRLEKTAYELTENIPIGTYTMVQPADGGMARFAFMSSRFLKMTGLNREEAASDTMKAFACVHPDDLDTWIAINVESFNEKKPFFGETRLKVNGEIRWITAESFPRALPDGTTVWEGVLADVTDRKQAEQALSESLARFNELVDRVSIAVYIYWHRANGTMDFEYVSDSWCELNQIQREDLVQNPQLAWEVIHPDEFEDFKQLNEQITRERRPFAWEGRIIVNGKVRFVLIESTPVFFDNGDSRWFGFQQDITERKQAEASLQASNFALAQEIAERELVEQELKSKTQLLEKLSMQDGLTGIPNRRHFDQRAEAEWKRGLRTALPLSLMLIDIDNFKLYNDEYGHGAGDDCLRQLAQVLADCIERPLDLVARYGGEEFIVLLPETGMDGVLHLAEQMRASVEAMAIPHAHSSPQPIVTISIGVAVHEPGRLKRGLRDLQDSADQALYRAKHQGRNCIQAEARITPARSGR